ncbi:MAG: hypothetical protein AAF598_22390, partial [Bacteroidota bacterium]
MIKKSKFDLLDDEFILHFQDNEIDPLELPEDDQATKDKLEDLLDDGEKMWWIGIPNTERARKSAAGANFDRVDWELIRLSLFIPIILMIVFLAKPWTVILFIFWIAFIFAGKTSLESLLNTNFQNVRYYISNQDIQFIYPNLNESYEVGWDKVKDIILVENDSNKEIHFRIKNHSLFTTYDFEKPDKIYKRPVIQELQNIERVY